MADGITDHQTDGCDLGLDTPRRLESTHEEATTLGDCLVAQAHDRGGLKASARWVGVSQISKFGKSRLTADAMDSVSGSTRVYSFNTANVSPWTCIMQP